MKIALALTSAALATLVAGTVMVRSEPVETLGVCSILPDKVDCWTLSGDRSPELSSRIGAFLFQQPSRSAQWGYGKEIRYLVLQTQPDVSITTQSDPHLRQLSLQTAQEWLMLSPVNVVEGQTRAVYNSTAYDFSQGSVLVMPFRRGAGGAVDGREIRLAAWKKIKVNRFDHFGGGGFAGPSFWATSLDYCYALYFEGNEAPPTFFVRYQALDSKGQVISVVDSKNRPSSREKLDKWITSDRKGQPFEAVAFIPQMSSVGNAYWVQTNIDPTSASKLKITMPKVIPIHVDFPVNPR